MNAVGTQFTERCGVQLAQTGVGRRDQIAAVRQSYAQVARTTAAEAAHKQRTTVVHQLFAELLFVKLTHHADSCAVKKKSSSPKLPDFSASASGGSAENTHGTPGAMALPTVSRVTCNASTTVPDVSPPATIKLFTPAACSLAVSLAKVCSIARLARCSPYSC
ncbi:hypothetical protein SDC9_207323 [bioreactor metagenome]|uniref:Uncharacterized protein n=1 Tax=bioreactor metagenome TaxID=1076179 RepID=A0A645J907_9ZZZZ